MPLNYKLLFLPKTKTELSRFAAEMADLAEGREAAEDHFAVDSE